MDIKNVTEFRNYIDLNQLRSLNPSFEAAAICVMDYERGCSCWNNNDRQTTYNNCKVLYARAVGVISQSFRAQFMAKCPDMSLNFYQDGCLIASIRR